MIGALALALALFQEPAEEKVRELVARLGADEIEAREEALKALVGMGEAVLPALRRFAESERDAEIVSRLKSAIREIERAAARLRVYREAKLVTLRVKDTPLKDVVREACALAGVEFSVADDIGGRTVSVEAQREPLLGVLDRMCAVLGEVSFQIADGKVQLVREKFVRYPSAYSGGFRVRLRRVATTHVNNFEAPATTVILYPVFDAQPDLRPRGATHESEPAGRAEGGAEVTFKPVSTGRIGGSSSSGNRGTITVDDVQIPWDPDVRIETACFAKEAPGTLRKLESLRIRAKFRFAAATRTLSCKVKSRGEEGRFEGLPIRVRLLGGHLQLEADRYEARFRSRVEELLDVDTLVAVVDGKEERCSPIHATPGFAMFRCPAESGEVELRVAAFDDTFEKDVEFELRDIVLRE